MNNTNQKPNQPLDLTQAQIKDQKSLENLLNKRNLQVDVQVIFQDAYFEEFLNNIH